MLACSAELMYYLLTYFSYRVVDAVDRLSEKEKGFKVGVINKVSVNLIDEEAMNLIGNSKFVLVCESWNEKTGLGSRVRFCKLPSSA